MQPVQNIRPISDFRNLQDEVLNEMDSAPVILAQRSKPRAVLVNVEEWNRISERMMALEQAAKMLHRSLKEEREDEKHYSLDDIEAMIEQKKAVAA